MFEKLWQHLQFDVFPAESDCRKFISVQKWVKKIQYEPLLLKLPQVGLIESGHLMVQKCFSAALLFITQCSSCWHVGRGHPEVHAKSIPPFFSHPLSSGPTLSRCCPPFILFMVQGLRRTKNSHIHTHSVRQWAQNTGFITGSFFKRGILGTINVIKTQRDLFTPLKTVWKQMGNSAEGQTEMSSDF